MKVEVDTRDYQVSTVSVGVKQHRKRTSANRHRRTLERSEEGGGIRSRSWTDCLAAELFSATGSLGTDFVPYSCSKSKSAGYTGPSRVLTSCDFVPYSCSKSKSADYTGPSRVLTSCDFVPYSCSKSKSVGYTTPSRVLTSLTFVVLTMALRSLRVGAQGRDIDWYLPPFIPPQPPVRRP